MRTWTGKEKLTRGWWVNQHAWFETGQRWGTEWCKLGDVFWTDGFDILPAPPGRELVGFTIRIPKRWQHEFPYAPGPALSPGLGRGFRRERFVWPTYAEAASEYKKRGYSDSRILPVTRKKRAATPDLAPAASHAPISLSDALDDQLRGCLRIPKRSPGSSSFFSETDHEAVMRMCSDASLYGKENLIAELKAEMKR